MAEKHVMQYQTVHFNLNGKDVSARWTCGPA